MNELEIKMEPGGPYEYPPVLPILRPGNKDQLVRRFFYESYGKHAIEVVLSRHDDLHIGLLYEGEDKDTYVLTQGIKDVGINAIVYTESQGFRRPPSQQQSAYLCQELLPDLIRRGLHYLDFHTKSVTKDVESWAIEAIESNKKNIAEELREYLHPFHVFVQFIDKYEKAEKVLHMLEQFPHQLWAYLWAEYNREEYERVIWCKEYLFQSQPGFFYLLHMLHKYEGGYQPTHLAIQAPWHSYWLPPRTLLPVEHSLPDNSTFFLTEPFLADAHRLLATNTDRMNPASVSYVYMSLRNSLNPAIVVRIIHEIIQTQWYILPMNSFHKSKRGTSFPELLADEVLKTLGIGGNY